MCPRSQAAAVTVAVTIAVGVAAETLSGTLQVQRRQEWTSDPQTSASMRLVLWFRAQPVVRSRADTENCAEMVQILFIYITIKPYVESIGTVASIAHGNQQDPEIRFDPAPLRLASRKADAKSKVVEVENVC